MRRKRRREDESDVVLIQEAEQAAYAGVLGGGKALRRGYAFADGRPQDFVNGNIHFNKAKYDKKTDEVLEITDEPDMCNSALGVMLSGVYLVPRGTAPRRATASTGRTAGSAGRATPTSAT